jgi:hypothetical protein
MNYRSWSWLNDSDMLLLCSARDQLSKQASRPCVIDHKICITIGLKVVNGVIKNLDNKLTSFSATFQMLEQKFKVGKNLSGNKF